ncbi:pentatricopeptide repeat-containing protein At1g71490-like [Ananas comosus]|uniref:Pentatricopeptide repeat-containing protein At1g71490-like n=1 Tax=Ananas comosus TaxID=4615 RepID=A0A6P5ECH1_ANACO|nr:pentatricopeptide repeat-containing protein At1g71490-like [Ananas comosus]
MGDHGLKPQNELFILRYSLSGLASRKASLTVGNRKVWSSLHCLSLHRSVTITVECIFVAQDTCKHHLPRGKFSDELRQVQAHGIDSIFESCTKFRMIDKFRPSPLLLLHPISSLLHCASAINALPEGLQLHALALSLGLHPHPSLVPRLTAFYAAHGLLSSAHAVAASASATGYVLPWNLLISSYLRHGLSSHALAAFNEMLRRGVSPDRFTYPSALRACAELSDLESGREIHRRIEVEGDAHLGVNVFAHNALIAMYAKCGDLGAARKVFDEMPQRDIVSWNTIISAYAADATWHEAFALFDRMRTLGLELNSVTWNTIASGYIHTGDFARALRLISQMMFSGSDLDFVTFVIGLNACSRAGSLRSGRELHGAAIRARCDGLETVRNALITMYSRCGDPDQAHVLFRFSGPRGLVTWNAMIAAFAVADRAEGAASVFAELARSGLRPNYVTVVTYLALCARVANLQHGRELHCYIVKEEGFEGYRLLWNSLVDMYAKSGRISTARRVFNAMNNRDEVSYTSLIAGYGIQGEGPAALGLFDEMVERNIRPDHVSLVAVLSACSHSGLVSDGEKLFRRMVEEYKIRPRMEHYSCMVDLFARAGLLKKAEAMLEQAPLLPTAAMWAALVAASQVYGDAEIGLKAANRLLEMGTENSGHYILIANLYAARGCWEELAKVRMRMRDMGVRKAPGLAWADIGNGFHPFAVGDRSNPLAPEIYEVLDELSEQMRDVGRDGDDFLGFFDEF